MTPDPFDPTTQLVDSSVEFTTWLQSESANPQGTQLDLDIRSDGFDIIFHDSIPNPSGVFAMGNRPYRIDLTDLDPSLNLDISGMSFNAPPRHNVSEWGYTSDTAYVELTGFRSNATWSFDFEYSPAPVPIPGAVWLLGSGFIGIAGLRRFKK